MAKKLLVIDQNLAVHRLLEFTLSKEGYHIVAVEDGLTGLDTAYQERPDVILLNSQLEGLPLPRFMQKVREREQLRTTPVILMTQPNENLNPEQIRSAGVTDVIKKPLDAMEINATISRHIPPAPPAAARDRGDASQPSTSSTEDNQEMAQMEEGLGWGPRGRAPSRSAPDTPVETARPTSASGDESDLPYELQTSRAAAPSTPPAPAAPQEDLSLEDMLLTGADAMHYQPPAAPPPPPPPPPPEEPEAPSPLDELFAAQSPIPVKPSGRGGAPPAASKAQTAAPPTHGGLTRQETEAMVRAAVEDLTRTLVKETVERITKETVAELAERAVKAEIERLKADTPAD